MSEKKNTPKYVFGPVPSRRLGRSLGVDLIPFKSCTLDCVYCQIGRTTNHTIEREEYVPMEAVLAQIEEAVKCGPRPDYITMAGSGEPTLYKRLGELIDAIHGICDVPIDIITNGTMLWDDEVFEAAAKADLIVPSLDAGDEETYLRINRPAEGATFERLVTGLKRLSKTCPEKVWLEVFIVNEINDDPDHVRKIADLAREFNFSRVQLNTAVRPPAEDYVKMVPQRRMEELAGLFTPRAEIIADFPHPEVSGDFQAHADAVLDMLRRRPCTLDDIVDGMGAVRNEVIKAIDQLLNEKKIQIQHRGDRDYYLVR